MQRILVHAFKVPQFVKYTVAYDISGWQPTFCASNFYAPLD